MELIEIPAHSCIDLCKHINTYIEKAQREREREKAQRWGVGHKRWWVLDLLADEVSQVGRELGHELRAYHELALKSPQK